MTEIHSLPSTAIGRVSIIIKALNEEKRIARAIESSLRALRRLGGEVILADSCSTDQTIEIAKRYPIKIVQLANPAERCCGIGPQLGYQHSQCEYVYILDGDMELRPDFIDQAVEFLDAHPRVAGVGGRVVEHNLDSLEYKARVERNAHHMRAGSVDRLDMGGLYRRAAIEEVGYFSDRNLHSYEELDLAVRLRSRKWGLERIGVDAVDHHGHDVSAYTLLKKRWKSHYINGSGEVIRSAIGRPHFFLLTSQLREVKIYMAFLVWFVGVFFVSAIPPFYVGGGIIFLWIFIVGIIFPVIILFLRKKSIISAIYAYVSLIAHVGGFFRGFFSARVNERLVVKDVLICQFCDDK